MESHEVGGGGTEGGIPFGVLSSDGVGHRGGGGYNTGMEE